ncbi:MAG: hypothetical protein Q7R35_12730 [Elusimicrobiota bacterium]|nr:hypothetical protein [Elusimicrobiota bacterium]
MYRKFIFMLTLILAVPYSYAGDGKIPWGDSRHDYGFKYLQEKSPELEELWDELDGEEQGAKLTDVREASAERYEQVAEYYQILMRKWDIEALREYGNGVSPADMKAFQIWLGEEKAGELQKKMAIMRYVMQKAETEGLTAEEVLNLEPYLKTDAIDALRHAKLSKEFSKNKAPPRDYLSARSSTGLHSFAGKTPGLVGGKDLSRFYDGSTAGGDPAGLAGPGAAAIKGGAILSPEARGTTATTIKFTAPGALEGGDAEPAPVVKSSGKGRGLTETEIAAARTMYGDKIKYEKVRIVTGEDMTFWGKILTHGGAAVTWGNTIYFPNDGDKKSLYNAEEQSDWMVHELGHTYQYQKDGWSYASKSVWEQITKGGAAYTYEITPGKDFGKYGIEQQATIVQDYYRGAISPSMRPEVERMLRKEGFLGGPGGG